MSTDFDVKELRQKLGWSRAQLADELGVDVSTVCRWENSGVPTKGMARAFLLRLAEARAEAALAEVAQ